MMVCEQISGYSTIRLFFSLFFLLLQIQYLLLCFSRLLTMLNLSQIYLLLYNNTIFHNIKRPNEIKTNSFPFYIRKYAFNLAANSSLNMVGYQHCMYCTIYKRPQIAILSKNDRNRSKAQK